MNTSVQEKAWVTYTYCALLALPALAAWMFCSILLFPQVERVWEQTGLSVTATRTPAHCIMTIARLAVSHSHVLLIFITLSIVACELKWSAWRTTLRKPVLYVLTALIILIALLGLCAVTTSAVLAVTVKDQ